MIERTFMEGDILFNSNFPIFQKTSKLEDIIKYLFSIYITLKSRISSTHKTWTSESIIIIVMKFGNLKMVQNQIEIFFRDFELFIRKEFLLIL